MSITPDHIEKSLKNAKRNYPELYSSRKEEVEKLITELHSWFDLFSELYFAKLFGYTELNAMKHREQRHHYTGIFAAEWVFARKYGEEFLPVIRHETGEHFQDDFFMLDDINKIPDMDDYSNPRFLRRIRGF